MSSKFLFTCSKATSTTTLPVRRAFATTASTMSSFYDFTAVRSDGTVISMEKYRGKVVYATNVASM